MNNNYKDLPPEAKAFIEKNLHKAEKHLSNPLIAKLMHSVGMDVNDIKKAIVNTTITQHEKAPEELDRLIKSSSPSETVLPSKTSTPRQTFTPQPTSSPRQTFASQPTSSLQQTYAPLSRTKIDTRSIIAVLAIIGLIGWLLYQFTDII